MVVVMEKIIVVVLEIFSVSNFSLSSSPHAELCAPSLPTGRPSRPLRPP